MKADLAPLSTPAAAPLTLDGVTADLAAIDAEREQCQALLAAAEATESALVEGDASEQDFSRHDMRLKNARRVLAKLDVRERRLIEAAALLEADTKQASYAALRNRYLAACRELSDSAASVTRHVAAVTALSTEADRSGFSLQGLPSLPPPGYSALGSYMVFRLALAVLAEQAAVAARTSERVPQLPARARLQSVRFMQWTALGKTAYQRGQIAGFTPAVCRQLVAAKRAEIMKRGMPFNPSEAAFGAGAAPVNQTHSAPAREETQ